MSQRTFSLNWLPWLKQAEPDPEPEVIPTVTVGGERIEIRPLDLETACEVLVLIAPYLVLLEDYLPDIHAALEAADRPRLLQAAFMGLRREMAAFPGDMTKFLAALLDRKPEWVAENAQPVEVLGALGVIDQVNSFTELYTIGRTLGLAERLPSNGTTT